jgi:hypothetical protein
MGPRSESTRLHYRRACLHDLGRAAANLLLKPDEAEDGETHTASPIQYQRNYALCAGDDPCNRPHSLGDALRPEDFCAR